MTALAHWFTNASPQTWSLRILHVSAVGQTLFVAIWTFLPFYRTWVGRALWVKSLSLAIYLDFAEAVYWWGPLPRQDVLAVSLFGLIAAGIWTQLLVLTREVWRGLRGAPPD